MRRNSAITLIELLTVIAIIAILAATIFPVYARAKGSAARSADISAMNTIRTAMLLYKADQGGFPPAVLGYAQYSSGNGGQLIPADRVRSFLYPRRVDSLVTFKPSYVRASNADLTTAVWPAADPRAAGSAPELDLNGDGRIDSGDDVAGARQAYNYLDDPEPVCNDLRPCSDQSRQLAFYKVSGYDVTETNRQDNGASHFEMRYSLFWTEFAINQGGNAFDDPRQLGYSEPPDGTVMFWNTLFRDYQRPTVPTEGRADLAVFVGGSAKPYDSIKLSQRSWRILP
ncbi:MAG: prepilin-type N-terminal cleavage/methylation domain-containing protein [Fimbriimonadaceae bacterium]|nr:prepilin-type N-terminal cleavage/methylation domain-containing protein [Fimbriimonadaceae bacterium]QYK55866.1 MAG: prepilin-type N-terminal cleavage/methylation domain-containing protein [Fimbriimonadaceae bacterium]